MAGTVRSSMGPAPPFIEMPERLSEANGTWLDVVTLPVDRALLTMSAKSVPCPPEILTVGRLSARSSSWLPSALRWPRKCTPPEKREVKEPVAGS